VAVHDFRRRVLTHLTDTGVKVALQNYRGDGGKLEKCGKRTGQTANIPDIRLTVPSGCVV